MTLRAPEYYKDPEYDHCGSTTKAILEVDSIVIPLCDSCLDDLRNDLQKYDNTIFYYKCNKFTMSKWGFNYGGICNKKGYEVDCLSTCEKPEKRGE